MSIERIYSRLTGRTVPTRDPRRETLEACRTAYERAYERACRGPAHAHGGTASSTGLPEGVGTREHAFALFCVLTDRSGAADGSRRLTRPMALWRWVELCPFLYLRQDHAAEALGEYLLWKEGTGSPGWTGSRARTHWLGEKIREGVRRAEEVEPHGLVALARETASKRRRAGSGWIRWMELL